MIQCMLIPLSLHNLHFTIPSVESLLISFTRACKNVVILGVPWPNHNPASIKFFLLNLHIHWYRLLCKLQHDQQSSTYLSLGGSSFTTSHIGQRSMLDELNILMPSVFSMSDTFPGCERNLLCLAYALPSYTSLTQSCGTCLLKRNCSALQKSTSNRNKRSMDYALSLGLIHKVHTVDKI